MAGVASRAEPEQEAGAAEDSVVADVAVVVAAQHVLAVAARHALEMEQSLADLTRLASDHLGAHEALGQGVRHRRPREQEQEQEPVDRAGNNRRFEPTARFRFKCDTDLEPTLSPPRRPLGLV